jgi:hypothetical protein
MRITNKARANRAFAALLTNEKIWFETGDPYRETVYDSLMAYPNLRIPELISELHHLAKVNGLDWEEIMEAAQRYYAADTHSEREEQL